MGFLPLGRQALLRRAGFSPCPTGRQGTIQ